MTQTQITGGTGVGETDEMIIELAADILDKMPNVFDVEAVSEKYPVMYTNSMNTVLKQVIFVIGFQEKNLNLNLQISRLALYH